MDTVPLISGPIISSHHSERLAWRYTFRFSSIPRPFSSLSLHKISLFLPLTHQTRWKYKHQDPQNFQGVWMCTWREMASLITIPLIFSTSIFFVSLPFAGFSFLSWALSLVHLPPASSSHFKIDSLLDLSNHFWSLLISRQVILLSPFAPLVSIFFWLLRHVDNWCYGWWQRCSNRPLFSRWHAIRSLPPPAFSSFPPPPSLTL